MNNISELVPENYGVCAPEVAAVSTMQMYLCGMETDKALAKIARIYTPKVLRIESGELVPVRSHIDGARYAAFIDEVVAWAIQEVEKVGDGVAEKVVDMLKEIDGKCIIERASVEFMSFVEDAYMFLKKD